MGAALGSAVAASACCTIPLALVSLGVGLDRAHLISADRP